MFQDLIRRLIETGFGGFVTRLKFIKFGLSSFFRKVKRVIPNMHPLIVIMFPITLK